ncbi:MAG: sensor histidine kinase [Microthrixaceae bacterium]
MTDIINVTMNTWHRRSAVGGLWSLVALGVTGVFLTAMVASSGSIHLRYAYDSVGLLTLLIPGFAIPGVLITRARADLNFGRWFVWTGVLLMFWADVGLYEALAQAKDLPGVQISAWLVSWLWIWHLPLFSLSLLMFPTGSLPSPRWRLAIAPPLGAGLIATIGAFAPGTIGVTEALVDVQGKVIDNPLALHVGVWFTSWCARWGMPLVAISTAVALVTIVRLKGAHGHQRQQLKWVAYTQVMGIAVPVIIFVVAPGSDIGPALAVLQVIMTMAGVTVAMMRHQLLDIDVVVERTVVYSIVSATVIGVYAAAIALMSLLFVTDHQRGNPLVIALSVLVGFPVRDRVQDLVRRRFYGDRDRPYELIASHLRTIGSDRSPEQLLSELASLICSAMKVPWAGFTLEDSTVISSETLGEHPGGTSLSVPSGHRVEEFPMINLGSQRGHLRVALRNGESTFSTEDRRLLSDLAQQGGMIATARKLMAELQRSRLNLVTAQAEERRRLRRDLHDGLGPQLTAITLKIDAARNHLLGDVPLADVILAEVRQDTRDAIEDVRRLVYDLRPPALAELGLDGAIRRLTGGESRSVAGPVVSLDVVGDLGELSAAVELAAYRIVTEAITNATRHGRAKSCSVRLAVGNQLRIEVSDDGNGLHENWTPGVGITSMRERVSELDGSLVIHCVPGGGTRIVALIPLGPTTPEISPNEDFVSTPARRKGSL